MVRASRDVEVHAVADHSVTGYTFSGAGGAVGLGASVSVWSVGKDFSATYEDSTDDGDSDSSNALQGEGGSDATSDAGGQADSGVSGLSGQLNAYQGDSNANTANSRVANTLGAAAGSLSSGAITGTQLGNKLTTPVSTERGTTASIGNADTRAGHDIRVTASETMEVDLTLGNLAVGAIGAGASVAVLNVSGQVTAKAGGKLRAGETIDVDATFVQDVDVLSVALQGGFIGLGASVVVINDTSAVRALILDNSAVDGAATVTVSASGDQTFKLQSTGVQVGAQAAGASFTKVSVGDDNDATKEVNASIGNNVDVGKVAAVGALNVEADSKVKANGETFALAGGSIAATINFAYVNVNTDTQAAIGANAEITVTGAVSLQNRTDDDATTDVFALSVGLGVIGSSIAGTTIATTPSTSIGDNAVITAGSLMVGSHNFDGLNANGHGALAKAEAAGGGLLVAKERPPGPRPTRRSPPPWDRAATST